tara:strand:- start:5092 stop:5457 length:366 start_codon:yes stop_codon:yes gene_type:complete
MEMMIEINNSNNYQEAQHKKIDIIREFINSNKWDVEYLIYIHGFELALSKYINKFKIFNSNPSVLVTELAIMIINDIINIYESQVVNSEISESFDSDLQFMEDRCEFNKIIELLISENTNY